MLYVVLLIGLSLGVAPYVLVRFGLMPARVAGLIGTPSPFLLIVVGTWMIGGDLIAAIIVGGVYSIALWWLYTHDGPRIEELARREGRQR